MIKYQVEFKYPKNSRGAKAVGTRLRKSDPFEERQAAQNVANWLKIMGCEKVRVIEKSIND